MTLFGNVSTWLLLLAAWSIGAVVVSILFGAICSVEERVARWRQGK